MSKEQKRNKIKRYNLLREHKIKGISLITKYRLIAIGGDGAIFICDQVMFWHINTTLHYRVKLRCPEGSTS